MALLYLNILNYASHRNQATVVILIDVTLHDVTLHVNTLIVLEIIPYILS